MLGVVVLVMFVYCREWYVVACCLMLVAMRCCGVLFRVACLCCALFVVVWRVLFVVG